MGIRVFLLLLLESYVIPYRVLYRLIVLYDACMLSTICFFLLHLLPIYQCYLSRYNWHPKSIMSDYVYGHQSIWSHQMNHAYILKFEFISNRMNVSLLKSKVWFIYGLYILSCILYFIWVRINPSFRRRKVPNVRMFQ